jgi:hypothetical protein
MKHCSQEFDRFSERPGSQQEKWRACGWILLGCVRIISLNHPVSKMLHGNLAHAKFCSCFRVPGIPVLATLRAAPALPEPQMRWIVGSAVENGRQVEANHKIKAVGCPAHPLESPLEAVARLSHDVRTKRRLLQDNWLKQES